VKITATSTGKVPNTSPTAASSGSDLNGMAARNAAMAIKERLIAFLAERYQADRSEIRFLPNRIRIKEHEISFDEAISEAYRARVHLSAAGFYATPKIHWDRAAARGRPFFYFAYGAAVSEVVIDTLTGENRILRADILHDVGESLNPAVDLGQIEGGFVQGAGWLTTEELVWDERGRLLTHAPSTYKVPACSDRPIDLRIKL
jgi:xanthine dehydrogenase large subunit